MMAKLADYEFPEIELEESVELTRLIYDKLGGKVRRDGLASTLRMSPTGGAFGTRLNALRIWGLAERRGDVKLTSLGIQISSPTSLDEESHIMRRLATSVPLFNELHERIDDSAVDQGLLSAMIQEITNAEMNEIDQRVAVIERIFEGIRGYLRASDDLQAEKDAIVKSLPDVEELPNGWIEFRYDDGALRMRETPTNLDMLIATLESRRDRLSS